MRTVKPGTCLKLALALLVIATCAQAQTRRNNRSLSFNTDNRNVTSCGDLRMTYDRQPAVTEEAEMTVPASQVATLRAELTNGGAFISGWDRNEYAVKTCKAAPPDDPNAVGILRDIKTSISGGGQLRVDGPAGSDWVATLIVMVPRLSNMDIQTRNGPVQLRDLAGVIRLNATNGPLELTNVGGVVDASTTNGPITSRGASGDQKVSAVNGPITIELSGRQWDGPGLQVSTRNGPLGISIPDGYASGIFAETSTRSPLSCSASICAGAMRTEGAQQTIRIGNAQPQVRVSTSNGPLSIRTAN